jgi:hypothetical protein
MLLSDDSWDAESVSSEAHQNPMQKLTGKHESKPNPEVNDCSVAL